ncbi:MAG: hypothetical protein VX527_07120 [Planctomycetota bacterium]|nr:hypothetical protein [Planctomycetota bacterium]
MAGAVRTFGQVFVTMAAILTAAVAIGEVSIEKVELLERQFNEPRAGAQDRTQQLDALLAARGELIETEPSHPNNIFWRTAQAKNLLQDGCSLNAIELSVRHGLPGRLQEERFDRAIQQALIETAAIEEVLPGAIETAPEGSDRLARLEALRRSRLPLLRGMALVLGAERNQVEDIEEARHEGIRLLTLSIPTLRGDEAIMASRQLALARVAIGEHDAAQEMITSLRWDGSEDPIENVALRLASHEITRHVAGWGSAAGRAQLVAATNTDPLERLLLIEQAARYWIRLSRELREDEDPEQVALYVDAERNAIEAFLLLRPENGGLSVENPRFLDLLIEERLGRLDIADVTASHVPESVLIAKAVPLINSPETVLRAREMLLPLVDRPGLIPRTRARLLALLVNAEIQAGLAGSASEHAITWSQIAPDRDEAYEASDQGIIQALIHWEQSPQDEVRQARLQNAINNMMENFPDHPNQDFWKMESASRSKSGGLELDAMTLYGSVSEDSEYRPKALMMQAFLVVEATLKSGNREAAIQAARSRLTELNEFLAACPKQRSREVKRAKLGIDLCEARVDLLDGNAVRALDKLTQPGMDEIEPEQAIYLHMARIDAAMATGRTGALEAVFDDLPFNVDAEVAKIMLPDLLAVSSTPLPLDAFQDPIQQTAAWKLAVTLEVAVEMNISNRMLVIEAMRRAGRCDQVLERLQEVLKTKPDLGDALFSKAECLRLDPDADQAEIIGIYTRLSNSEPSANPHRFWTAQLRLLQSMQADGRDPAKILARLNRLQRTYPDLGGPSYISEFAILRTELDGTNAP